MNPHIIEVPLEKSYRLINHGPTVLVSAHHNGVDDVMTAAWACALDFTPSKLMVVLDKMTATRTLIENSGTFVIQVPCAAQLKMTHFLGTHSLKEMPDKLEQSGVELFRAPGHSVPLVAGCTAWMVCKLIPEPHNHQAHDLFIGEIIGAWADDRVFQNGHWSFETSPPEYRSLHYIAGGQFYAIGESLVVPGVEAS